MLGGETINNMGILTIFGDLSLADERGWNGGPNQTKVRKVQKKGWANKRKNHKRVGLSGKM